MKKLTLRIDRTDTHTHLTLFVNGANAGKLCMKPDEARVFTRILRCG